METENKGKPMSGCLKVIMIAASVLVILVIIAYFAIWRVPYKKDEVTKVLNEIDGMITSYRSVPPENNGWSDYKKALDGIDFTDPSTPNSSLEYRVFEYVHLGIPKEKAADIDEFLENNKDKLKDVDLGFEKNYVIDDGLLTGDYRNATSAAQKIEPAGEFLILCGDRDTDLMQVSKRYLQAVHLTSNTVENLTGNRSPAGFYAIKRLRWFINAKDLDRNTCRFLITQLERLSFQRSSLADKMRMYLSKMEVMKKSLVNMPASPLGPFFRIYFEREMQIVEMTFVGLIDAFDKSEVEGFKKFDNLKSRVLSTTYNYIVPPLKDEFKLFAAQEAYSKGMVIAAALKLYKTEHGKYPENIEALVPKYLKALPYDDFSIDKKFTYLGKANGNVILYSVGIDGKDNGGKDFDFDTGTGDFVVLNTQSPPSSDIQTGNLQPLWSVEKKTDDGVKEKGKKANENKARVKKTEDNKAKAGTKKK